METGHLKLEFKDSTYRQCENIANFLRKSYYLTAGRFYCYGIDGVIEQEGKEAKKIEFGTLLPDNSPVISILTKVNLLDFSEMENFLSLKNGEKVSKENTKVNAKAEMLRVNENLFKLTCTATCEKFTTDCFCGLLGDVNSVLISGIEGRKNSINLVLYFVFSSNDMQLDTEALFPEETPSVVWANCAKSPRANIGYNVVKSNDGYTIEFNFNVEGKSFNKLLTNFLEVSNALVVSLGEVQEV